MFSICGFRIGSSLRKIASETMKEGRTLEVKKQLEFDEKVYNDWGKSETDQVELTVSFYIGWNKRSSGNMYEYLSDHAFFIGCLSQKIIIATVITKQCRTCSSHEIKGIEPPEHNFPENYT